MSRTLPSIVPVRVRGDGAVLGMTAFSQRWTDVGVQSITDVGVAALASLTSLTSLNLFRCSAVTDAGIAALAPLTSLTIRR